MKSLPRPSRRTFLQTALLAGAGAALSPRSWGRVVGANGDVRIGIIGLNGRGKNHLDTFAQVPGARVVALCDVDPAILLRRAAGMVAAPKLYGDLRRLLDDPQIDAVSIAMPNHWHSLAAIWALQAGKDVYVEKPVSHNVWEGEQLVRAAARSPQVVQAGTQIRSNSGVIEARAWLREGHLGRIKLVRGLCYKRRASIGRTQGPQPLPPGVDYDLWCGPAPVTPLRRARLHYDWHWVWPTGNGDLGNQGIHQMDISRWLLGESGIAPRTLSVGGRLGYVDDAETPNTQVIVHDYPTAPLVFEVRGLPARSAPGSPEAMALEGASGPMTNQTVMGRYPGDGHGASIGIIVECEGGRVIVPSYTTAFAYDPQGKLIRRWSGGGDVHHFSNFIDVVRSRRKQDLNGPVAEGHVSSALCHLGNISYRVGKDLPAGEIAEKVRGNSALAEASGRMLEHLGNNGLDVARTPVRLGMPLVFDPQNSRFQDNDAANALLTREYRAPFEVPTV